MKKWKLWAQRRSNGCDKYLFHFAILRSKGEKTVTFYKCSDSRQKAVIHLLKHTSICMMHVITKTHYWQCKQYSENDSICWQSCRTFVSGSDSKRVVHETDHFPLAPKSKNAWSSSFVLPYTCWLYGVHICNKAFERLICFRGSPRIWPFVRGS
jgi:hypothetical protein